MDAFLLEWNGKFGAGVQPPEWVFALSADVDKQQEHVARRLIECESRIGKLTEELDQELFLLCWLRKVCENGVLNEATCTGLTGTDVLDEFVQSTHHHVQGQVLEPGEKEALNGSPQALGRSEQNLRSPVHTPDISSRTLNSEDSPSSSEYHTAGQNSSPETPSLTNLAEEGPDLAEYARKRLAHNAGSKESEIAQEVFLRVRDKDRGHHRSCHNLTEKSSKSDSPKQSPPQKLKRPKSAPALNPIELNLVEQTTRPVQTKKRLLSTPTPRSNFLSPGLDSNTDGSAVSTEHSTERKLSQPHTQHHRNTANKSRVILRRKLSRSPSLPMNQEEGLNQWKGSGGSSTVGVNRSSNGLLDSYESFNFMVNNDEDSDPALINVLASRMRGSLRTPRTSVSTDQNESPRTSRGDDEGGQGITSPSEDRHNTPIPGVNAAGAVFGESAKQVAPLRKRSSTHDSSPIKRERFSYHYSDDECLTPKLDSGDHGSFAGNSPIGSNQCSHRNSRGSNGIIDEEAPLNIGVQKRDSLGIVIGRKDTITPENASSEKSHRASKPPVDRIEDDDKSSLTATLTARDSVFEKSDSYSELGSLDFDIERTLSKLRDKPEMSMATLLDIKENERMNVGADSEPYKDLTLEDFENEGSIDEATISAFTLSNDLYGSRSNSASSLPGLFSDNSGTFSSPPEPESPVDSGPQGVHVNLRQSRVVKRLNRKRMGMGRNVDLEMMTGGGNSDNDETSLSRSSTSLTSEEDPMLPSPLHEDLVSPVWLVKISYPIHSLSLLWFASVWHICGPKYTLCKSSVCI